MAGSYPDVPGYKFAYDLDGTVVVGHYLQDSTQITFSGANMGVLNNDNTDSVVQGTNGATYICLFFPEARSVSGVLFNSNWSTITFQWSNDTTTGLDGTWTTVGSALGVNTVLRTDLRTVVSLTATSVQSIRFVRPGTAGDRTLRNVHVYGSIAPSASPNRLRIVDTTSSSTTSGGTATGADIAAQLDFGNIPQRSNLTKQFKVVNNSNTQTANNITVTLSAPTDASPTLIGQYQISTDNVAFANAVNIGNLAPNTASGTLYIRDTISSTAQLSVWMARMVAHPTSWT